MSNCCPHGTILHFSLQSSRLNICYCHQDLHWRPFRPASPPRLRHGTSTPAYSSGLIGLPTDGGVWVARLSAIHFQGRSIRQVSCYTILGGFRLPSPPSCCLDGPTPFMVSDERAFRHLNPAFGSSRIASSAYQKWPTRSSHSKSVQGPVKRPRTAYTFKV